MANGFGNYGDDMGDWGYQAQTPQFQQYQTPTYQPPQLPSWGGARYGTGSPSYQPPASTQPGLWDRFKGWGGQQASQLGNWASANPGQAIAGGLGTAGSLLGLIGAFQGMGKKPQTTTRTEMAPPSAQELSLQQSLMAPDPFMAQISGQMQRGELPIPPSMLEALNRANAGAYSGMRQAGTEDLRRRGFTEASLGTGMSEEYNQALQNMQNAQAQQIVQLMTQMPSLAAGMQQARQAPQRDLLSALMNQRQATATQRQIAPKQTLYDTIAKLAPVFQSFGGMMGGAQRPQTRR